MSKMGLLSGKNSKVEDAYKKGTNEGYLQGYSEARKSLEAKIATLEEDTNKRLKVAEDQINLLGRLVQQLSKEQAGLSQETRSTIDKILKVLEAEGKLSLETT
ncbi:MAG: hypothetical protein FJ358_00675 [Thaumarchaeota archaeon]|nr:hypothetical protein [Nitrososphaerota archaeon]